MALTPSERRARRDARAQTIVNPDTGQPFRNYNALDTWQRNQRAKARGFTSRSQQRYRVESALVQDVKTQFPHSFGNFVGDRKATPTLARQFRKAFGTRGQATPAMRKVRADFLASALGGEFDWRAWRVEYNAI